MAFSKTLCLPLAAFVLSIPVFAQSPKGIDNFHQINEHLYRGAQPTAEGLRALAQLGVKTVLDLRESGTRAQEEKKVVEAAGMRYINMPFAGFSAPSHEQITKVLSLFNDDSAGPVFVHCRRGADRTGTVIACYRISHDHWTNARALAEAKADRMSWTEFAMHGFVQHYQAPPLQAAVTGSN